MKAYSKPASSAFRASSTSSRGPQSSLASATPISAIASGLPLCRGAKRSGDDVSVLADRVLGPVLDEGDQPLFPPDGSLRHLDVDLVHRRLDVRVDLVATLRDDLDGSELVEKRLGEPVDLRLRGLAPGVDAEVDDEPPAGAPLASEDERGIGHVPVIPSRGPHLNIRSASTTPAAPQRATTAIAPSDSRRASSSRNTCRISSRRYVSGRTSAIARRKAGMDSVDQNTPEMKTIGR